MKIHSGTIQHLKHIKWYGPFHHGTHIVPCIQSMVLMYIGTIMYSDWRVSACPFWLVVDFDSAIWSWKPKSKHRRNVSLSGKSGQTTAPAWGENINLASRELICAQVIFKGRHYFHFGSWVRIYFQRLAAWVSPTALRMTSLELHVWEFLNHRMECGRQGKSQFVRNDLWT